MEMGWGDPVPLDGRGHLQEHPQSQDRGWMGVPRLWAPLPPRCIPRGAGGALCVPPALGTSLSSHIGIDGRIICTQPFNYPVMAAGD